MKDRECLTSNGSLGIGYNIIHISEKVYNIICSYYYVLFVRLKNAGIGTSGCIIEEVYPPTHREGHVFACPAFSPRSCWELLRATPPEQTKVIADTMSKADNEDIIQTLILLLLCVSAGR